MVVLKVVAVAYFALLSSAETLHQDAEPEARGTPGLLVQEEETKDPTVPSSEIRSKLGQTTNVGAQELLESAKRLFEAGLVVQSRQRIEQLQELENAPLQLQDEAAIWWASVAPEFGSRPVAVGPERPEPAKPLPASRSLPKLPKLAIKAMVMSKSDLGTVLLNIDGRLISIPLKPIALQNRLPVPASQFFDSSLSLELTQVLAESNPQTAKGPDGVEVYEISPECSFLHDGIVFNLEAFTKDTIVLRALPHNKLILVRTESAP